MTGILSILWDWDLMIMKKTSKEHKRKVRLINLMSFGETIRTLLKEQEVFLEYKKKCTENANILDNLKDSIREYKDSLKTSGFSYTIVDEEILVNLVDYFFEESCKKYTKQVESDSVRYSVEHNDLL